MNNATVTIGNQAAIPRDQEGVDMPAMARRMWPMTLMLGLGAVVAGVVVGIVRATLDDPLEFAQVGAWNPGLLFLGIGLLLATIVLVLVSVLGELRDGGTKVQRTAGVDALILKRPLTAKIFPMAMMLGLIVLVVALAIGFVQAAKLDTDPSSAADIGAWLAPLRFAGVALIFTGIAFALLTVVNVLRFQVDRIGQIITASRTG
jgi:hypothetical protein